MKKLYLLFSVIVLICSCGGQNVSKDSALENFRLSITESLDLLNLVADVNVSKKRDQLSLKLFFTKDYFFDDLNLEIIVKYLLCDGDYKIYQEVNQISFICYFDGLADGAEFWYLTDELHLFRDYLKQYPNSRKILEESCSLLTGAEGVYYNLMIDDLREELLKNDFTFKGGVLQLILLYGEECDSEVYSSNHLRWLINMNSAMEEPLPEKLEVIREKCDSLCLLL
ncbi:MAG: hypothetical protein AB8B53_02750 [Flavobacteriales bacterium]